jgi:uncharacterized membrane protein
LLSEFPKEDREEILYDYEEHFRMGLAEGKSEEEISKSLGDVYMIARQFKATFTIKRAETTASAGNLIRAVLATVGLGFFNLVFVLGPFMGLVGILIGLFAAAIGLTMAGLGVFLALIISPMFSAINTDMNPVFLIFSSTGLTCFGLLFLIGDVYLTKFFFKGTLAYLKWNISVITQK